MYCNFFVNPDEFYRVLNKVSIQYNNTKGGRVNIHKYSCSARRVSFRLNQIKIHSRLTPPIVTRFGWYGASCIDRGVAENGYCY